MTSQLLHVLIIGGSLALFGLDLLLPLGVANSLLYAGMVFLAALSPSPRLPVLTATGCSTLTIVGAWFSPSIPGIPLWVALSNRTFSLVAIWAPILFLVQRRQMETLLRRVNESLETRVQSRTAEIAAQEQALRQSEEKYRTLVEHAVYGIYRTTTDGRFSSVNPENPQILFQIHAIPLLLVVDTLA